MSEWEDRERRVQRYGLRVPLYSHRVGLITDERANDAWQSRHIASAEPLPVHGCRCPGPINGSRECRQNATQEDILCDQCRDWCICTDGEDTYLIADYAEGKFRPLASVVDLAWGVQ